MRLTRLRRIVAGGATIALGAAGLVAFTAINAVPAGAVTNANTTYEVDCTTSLQPGVAAPFAITANLSTTSNTLSPTGATFGVSGAVTTTLVGPFLAALADNGVLGAAGLGVGLTNLTLGSTDGTATGTAQVSPSVAQSPSNVNSSALTGVSFGSGATTISFTGGTLAVGDGIAGTGIGQAAVTSVGAGTATLSSATTAASSGSYTAYAASSMTAPVSTSATAFTTNGTNGGTADIGVVGLDTVSVVVNLTIGFGGANGVGTANCLETGWDASNNPSFPQTNETTPGFPPASLGGPGTPLVAATGGHITQPGVTAGQGITPPTAAFVNLADTAPTPNNQTVAVGQGLPAQITLTATTGSYPVNANGFHIVGGSPQTIGSLTITQVGTSAVVNTTNTASAPETDTFQFNACDTLAAGSGGPVCSTTPGTITVKIGTPPVVQPFTEQVTGGLLVISCDSPANYITPAGQNQSPAPTGSNPLQQCPEFQMPPITLDGLEQTVTGTTGNTGGNPSGSNAGTIYISDNRGCPMDQWTLSASFIPTASNPNPTCAGVVAFCNGDPSINALHAATNGALDAQIAPNYLQVGNIACTADATGGTGTPPYNPPNLNPDATPTTGGNFGSTVALCSASQGQSGGTFLYNATYTLTIPESVYAGDYFGSIQYTIG